MCNGSISLRDAYDRGDNNFNAIRLIAARFVIYGHSYAVTKEGGADFVTLKLGYGFTGGLAVDAFFVISGFLITASVQKGDVAFYIVSRALRIFPALWVCLILTAFGWGPMIAQSGVYSLTQAVKYFTHLALLWNYELFLPGVFTQNRDQGVNGPLWSVIVEGRMYLAFLLLYLFGILRSRVTYNCLFFIILIASFFSPGGNIAGTSMTDRHVILMFLIGAFAWMNRETVILSPVSIVVCLFILAFFHLTPKFELAYFLTFPYLIFALAFGPRWPWPRFMGDYSYGVYLWGWPIQQLVLLPFPSMSVHANQVISILLAIGAGAISWHFIERPALGQKTRVAEALHRVFGPTLVRFPARQTRKEK